MRNQIFAVAGKGIVFVCKQLDKGSALVLTLYRLPGTPT